MWFFKPNTWLHAHITECFNCESWQSLTGCVCTINCATFTTSLVHTVKLHYLLLFLLLIFHIMLFELKWDDKLCWIIKGIVWLCMCATWHKSPLIHAHTYTYTIHVCELLQTQKKHRKGGRDREQIKFKSYNIWVKCFTEKTLFGRPLNPSVLKFPLSKTNMIYWNCTFTV